MIEQSRKRRMVAILVSGLAVAAVAGVAIAGTAVARSRQSSRDSAVAGGGPATPVAQTPVTPTDSPQVTPTPDRGTPARPTPAPATPTAAPTIGKTIGTKPVVPKPPQAQEPPADPVAACKAWLKDADAENAPGSSAKVVARLNGAPGTVLILADSKNWVGCDTAFARNGGGKGSIRQPAPIGTPPLSAGTFAVANNLIPVNGQQYEYFWAAGRLPAGITKVTYWFPDDKTTEAVIKGNYWVMQHLVATPWKEGIAPAAQVEVTLSNANGPVKTFELSWGEDTCAQITHGC
jgi:hypothetical protein